MFDCVTMNYDCFLVSCFPKTCQNGCLIEDFKDLCSGSAETIVRVALSGNQK